MNRPRDLWAFEGRWQLRRKIVDDRAGQVVQAAGQARLRRSGTGLDYDEEVRLHLPGQIPLEGKRRYLWRADGSGVAVSFEDGRAFHRIALNQTSPEAAHWCDPDHYDVRYDFTRWPRWSSDWRVRGPRKSYTMFSQYAPAAEP